MQNTFLLNFIDLIVVVFQVLILIRVVLSWVRPNPGNPLIRFLLEVTEPILAPFQRILPPMAGLDFSPILALITLQILQSLAHNLL